MQKKKKNSSFLIFRSLHHCSKSRFCLPLATVCVFTTATFSSENSVCHFTRDKSEGTVV